MRNIFFSLVFLSWPLFAQEPLLTIVYGGAEKYYRLSELIGHKDAVNVSLQKDPIYPDHNLTYRAVPLASLFHGVVMTEGAVIEFTTEDGYNAPVDSSKLLNREKKLPVAYLAIEDPTRKWPRMRAHERSAGPFLLIWGNAHPEKFEDEKWPYWVTKFEAKSRFEELYPGVLPKSNIYNEGFRVFRENCFSCHTLNKQGAATLGPDLNYPYSPTEYFAASYLRKLIREPSSIRYWSNSKMKGFSKSKLSDDDLSALLDYLEHMSKHKAN